jgi:RNA polymerase sigma-70 factor (ECF subfamily)
MSEEENLCIILARRGDDVAFGRLVDTYQRPVFNLCHRMLGTPMAAEDAAQETFLRAYTHLPSYDADRSFSSWLLSIASHYCIDQLRQRHFRLLSLDDLTTEPDAADDLPEPEEVVLDRETEQEVRALLQKLPGDYRAAVVLRYWYQFSYEEIAKALNTTVSAIKSRLFRARQMMAEVSTQSLLVAAGRQQSPRPPTSQPPDHVQGCCTASESQQFSSKRMVSDECRL